MGIGVAVIHHNMRRLYEHVQFRAPERVTPRQRHPFDVPRVLERFAQDLLHALPHPRIGNRSLIERFHVQDIQRQVVLRGINLSAQDVQATAAQGPRYQRKNAAPFLGADGDAAKPRGGVLFGVKRHRRLPGLFRHGQVHGHLPRSRGHQVPHRHGVQETLDVAVSSPAVQRLFQAGARPAAQFLVRRRDDRTLLRQIVVGAVVEFCQQRALPDAPHLRPHGRGVRIGQQVQQLQVGRRFDKAGALGNHLSVGDVPPLGQPVHGQVVHHQHLDGVALFGRQFHAFAHLFGQFAAAVHVRGFPRTMVLAQVMQQQGQLQQSLVPFGRLLVKPLQPSQLGLLCLRKPFDLVDRQQGMFIHCIAMVQVVRRQAGQGGKFRNVGVEQAMPVHGAQNGSAMRLRQDIPERSPNLGRTPRSLVRQQLRMRLDGARQRRLQGRLAFLRLDEGLHHQRRPRGEQLSHGGRLVTQVAVANDEAVPHPPGAPPHGPAQRPVHA